MAFEARERAERTNAIREAMLAKQRELDELRLYITQTSSAVEADHVRHAQLIGKIATEMQQLRANAAADYAARKQLITKKKARACVRVLRCLSLRLRERRQRSAHHRV